MRLLSIPCLATQCIFTPTSYNAAAADRFGDVQLQEILGFLQSDVLRQVLCVHRQLPLGDELAPGSGSLFRASAALGAGEIILVETSSEHVNSSPLLCTGSMVQLLGKSMKQLTRYGMARARWIDQVHVSLCRNAAEILRTIGCTSGYFATWNQEHISCKKTPTES